MSDQILREHEGCNHMCGLKCMPWAGIFAGALIAVGLTFLLSLFGAAISLSAFRTSAEGSTTLAIGGYIGMLIGTIAIMFLAGWIAGYFGRRHHFHQNFGALYGFAAWCIALVIMVLIATQTMQFISANLYSLTDRKITNARLYNDTVTRMTTDNTYTDTNFNDAEAARLLKQSLFLTFAMFFIGAMSSALGGYCGVQPCDKYCSSNKIDCSTT